ncbi:MAG: 1-deoxy-D-xylulose-5-phosphate reductoisomerase, partial [Betaproteobacteria bacterium]|nr:1-deoxy-D-xylulose-5-phosphate reductoisomerase [Betaproteobacteria bacterium]
AGKRVLLANKESLVVAGELFMRAMRDGGGELLPIDSEHSAILQSLPEQRARWDSDVREITLTASGGPFRRTDPAQLGSITPEQACAHPNWSMGRKISVDSATMMNKALEVIEAHHLFGMPAERIRVLIHPQSIVHSMVTYHDGSVVAQLGVPDMRTPIAYGLAWPRRIASGSSWLDLARIGRLDFDTPDAARFPGLGLAYAALGMSGGACAVLNAANEVAVQAFLDGALGFTDIHRVNAATLEQLGASPAHELGALLELDARARRQASAQVRALAH